MKECWLISRTSGVAKMLTTTLIRNQAPNKVPKSPTKVFPNGSYIPALTAYGYRGYIISAWARPEFTNVSTSVGIVYKWGQLGSLIQVQRIEGESFGSKEQADQHGLKLCKEWIDKQFTV
jgi:hypothetical protein